MRSVFETVLSETVFGPFLKSLLPALLQELVGDFLRFYGQENLGRNEKEQSNFAQTGFCKVFCENLRFPALFCENLRLQNA